MGHMASFWRKSEQGSSDWGSRLTGAARHPLHPLWARVAYTTLVTLLSLTLLLVGFSWLGGKTAPNENLISAGHSNEFRPDAEKTDEYIRRLDIAWFERNGSDYLNPKFSLLRLGLPLGDLDPGSYYDFQRVTETERQLQMIDRKKVLRHIFNQVTGDSRTNADKHLAILKFLHKSSFHNLLYPVYPDRNMVMDPLVVLTLGEMYCGVVSRLAVDLFESAGLKGRLVQLGGHVIAEVYYDDAWHYVDGDIFGNGEAIVNEDGTIPSVVQLSRDPYRIDALAHYREPYLSSGRSDEWWKASNPELYPSWIFFGKSAYGPIRGKPVYYEKTATESQERNQYYGWDYYLTRSDEERVLHRFEPFYQPGAVMFTEIDLENDSTQGVGFTSSGQRRPTEMKICSVIRYLSLINRVHGDMAITRDLPI